MRIVFELVALRHQVTVLRRQRPGQLRLFSTDRLLWVWLYRIWPQVLNAMVLVKPATVGSVASQRLPALLAVAITPTGAAQDEHQPRCGLYVVDLETGDIAHSLTVDGIVTELYDVAVIAGKSQPAALGPASAEVRRMISVGPAS